MAYSNKGSVERARRMFKRRIECFKSCGNMTEVRKLEERIKDLDKKNGKT